MPSPRRVERLGFFPGTSFELPILTLLLLGCSNIPNPGHLSLFWLFFKALGLIPASEGPSTPSLCPSASSGVSTWGSPLCRGQHGAVGKVWSQEAWKQLGCAGESKCLCCFCLACDEGA